MIIFLDIFLKVHLAVKDYGADMICDGQTDRPLKQTIPLPYVRCYDKNCLICPLPCHYPQNCPCVLPSSSSSCVSYFPVQHPQPPLHTLNHIYCWHVKDGISTQIVVFSMLYNYYNYFYTCLIQHKTIHVRNPRKVCADVGPCVIQIILDYHFNVDFHNTHYGNVIKHAPNLLNIKLLTCFIKVSINRK